MKLTIIRNAKVHTEMPVYHLQDRNLSLRAMGLLTKMLALPDDWDFSINGLASICRDGVSSVRSALKELEENGYIVRMNDHAGNGRFQRVTYIIYEVPQKALLRNGKRRKNLKPLYLKRKKSRKSLWKTPKRNRKNRQRKSRIRRGQHK